MNKPRKKPQTKPKSFIAASAPGPARQALEELEGEIRKRLFKEVEGDPAKVDRLMAGLDELRLRLSKEQKTEIESIAIEQILTCWTQTTISALRLQEMDPRLRPAREGSFWEHRHHFSQSRLLRSLDLYSRLKSLPLTNPDEPDMVTIRVVREGTDVPDREWEVERSSVKKWVD